MSDPGRSPVERIVLEGEYDLVRRDELHETFSRVDGTCPVVLDLRDVTYADSSFFNELATLRLNHPGCRIILEKPTAEVLRVLQILRFQTGFDIE